MSLISFSRDALRSTKASLRAIRAFLALVATAVPGVASPILVKTFEGGVGNWSAFKEFYAADGYLYFPAEDGENDGDGPSLWRTDGTAEGTLMLRNIRPYLTETSNMATVGTKVLFFVEGTNGYQLWRSDGTAQGTVKMHDTFITDWTQAPHSLTHVGTNYIYFAAYSGLHGMELWQTTADALSAELKADIFPGDDPFTGEKNSSAPRFLTAAGSTLFFSAFHPDYGRELWKVAPRGTTELVKDIYPGEGLAGKHSSNPEHLIWGGIEDRSLDDWIAFAARSAEGTEFWRSDGTRDGTFEVKNIDPAFLASSAPTQFTRVYDKTFFVAAKKGLGRELWVSSTPGAKLVKDIVPGDPFGAPAPNRLTNAGGTLLYFSADDTVHGRELWRSDGTPEGTYMVKNIFPGSGDADPDNMIYHNGLLYFGARSVDGYHFWQTDGTEAGTVRVDSVYPELQVIFEAPHEMAIMDGDLYVATRRSLWMIPGRGNTYFTWLDSYNVPADARGVTHDPDGDGLANILEYAFDRNPLQSDRGKLPRLAFSDGMLTFRYLRMRPDLHYKVEAATGFQQNDWSEIPVEEVRLGSEVIATIPEESGQLFYRLNVSLQP